jgi:SulP family sulfate permease
MEKLKPMLFSTMKHYTKEQFAKDVISGIIVAIIALPLSIALALASGVTPERGIYTAIAAGFVISFLGGSRVQIAGPTAAFATIVAGIAAENGMEGLALATIMAGIILIIMGLCRMGTLIFSHVNEQPLAAMKKSGLYDKVGAENFCVHIDNALARGAALGQNR